MAAFFFSSFTAQAFSVRFFFVAPFFFVFWFIHSISWWFGRLDNGTATIISFWSCDSVCVLDLSLAYTRHNSNVEPQRVWVFHQLNVGVINCLVSLFSSVLVECSFSGIVGTSSVLATLRLFFIRFLFFFSFSFFLFLLSYVTAYMLSFAKPMNHHW